MNEYVLNFLISVGLLIVVVVPSLMFGLFAYDRMKEQNKFWMAAITVLLVVTSMSTVMQFIVWVLKWLVNRGS